MRKVRIAVIGLGGMGRRWAKVADICSKTCLKLIIDTDRNKSKEVGEYWKCKFDSNLEALSSPEIDAVVISTPNAYLAPITKLALQNSKHVLCEKPAGINTKGIEENIILANDNRLAYMIGFNHRFHPALARAKRLVSGGAVGKIHFIRGVYGHGGRIDYDKEWRSKPELAGGGELLDQGIHLIDLAFWFLEDSFEKVSGTLAKNFWSKTLEDNAFVTLTSCSGTVVSLHASFTQWQKKFLWEIYGEKGFIIVEGLGGGYGLESLRYRKRNAKNGILNKEKVLYFPPKKCYENPDISLFSLWSEFIKSIKLGHQTLSSPSGKDAGRALEIIETIYSQESVEKR